MSSCIDDNNYCGGKQDVTEAVKIRLYPTDEQKKLINQILAIGVLFGINCL